MRRTRLDDDAEDWSDEWSDADVDRAPICSSCGVTMLPAARSHLFDGEFACDNEECDAYGLSD